MKNLSFTQNDSRFARSLLLLLLSPAQRPLQLFETAGYILSMAVCDGYKTATGAVIRHLNLWKPYYALKIGFCGFHNVLKVTLHSPCEQADLIHVNLVECQLTRGFLSDLQEHITQKTFKEGRIVSIAQKVAMESLIRQARILASTFADLAKSQAGDSGQRLY